MAVVPDPKLKSILAENIHAEDRLKMAIVGKPKRGKSWLAATAPTPITLFDFDSRAESLEGKAGVLIKRNPTILDVEQELSIAKANSLKGNASLNPATWVFDSVTYMIDAMETEIFRQCPTSYKIIRLGPTEFKVRQGYDSINTIQRYIPYLIAEFSRLGNVIFVYHEKPERDVAAEVDNKFEVKYTDQMTVNPQFVANTLSLFNEVYRVSYNSAGTYQVQVRPNAEFAASTTLLLDKAEQPNIQQMIAKHRAARAAKEKSNGL